jgi:hypothetical protein
MVSRRQVRPCREHPRQNSSSYNGRRLPLLVCCSSLSWFPRKRTASIGCARSTTGAFIQSTTKKNLWQSQGFSPSVWRVVHHHYIVPRIPPSLPLLRYEHGGLEVYYTDRANTDYLICPPDGKVENKSKACMGRFPYWCCINQDHVEPTVLFKMKPRWYLCPYQDVVPKIEEIFTGEC